MSDTAPMVQAEPYVEWVRTEGAWWASSFVFHMLLMCLLMMVSTDDSSTQLGSVVDFGPAHADEPQNQPIPDGLNLGEAPLDPTVLNPESLLLNPHGGPEQKEVHYSDEREFSDRGGGTGLANGLALGGLGGFTVLGTGPGTAAVGTGGAGSSPGEGRNAGAGGSGHGFGSRGTGHRQALAGTGGGTRGSERAVAAALNWLARHQMPDGSWSLGEYVKMCKDPTCTGPGTHKANAGATALGLLPFLAAGQTHRIKGPYQQTVYKGLYWLMQHQERDGNLAKMCGQPMYSHALATIALCEAFGMSKDKMVGDAAQAAIRYIETAQHPRTGGWRYTPGEEGDTSVVGWQVMALKSAQMAGLYVNAAAFNGAKQWLKTCSSGSYGGQFCYTPGSAATPTMTAVGLLCYQYLGTQRHEPLMAEGLASLMAHQPDPAARSLYYWYYATQVMHNVPGPDWDNWNRKMRRVLTESQCKQGCAMGSWDPDKPSRDVWGEAGGRVMVTSLGALTLEVYYRHLPLYQLDVEAGKSP